MRTPRPRLPRTRLGSLLGALVVGVQALLQGSFNAAIADPGRGPPGAPNKGGPEAQDVAPLIDVGGGPPLPRTIAAPAPFPTDFPWIELSLNSELIGLFHRSAAADPFADVGNSLLRGPETLFDDTLRCVTSLFPRSSPFPRPGESSGGITTRLLDVQTGPREGRVFSTFLSDWFVREQSFLARLSDADDDTGGLEDLDVKDLLRGQGKILWDAMRQTFRSKYRFRAEERLRDDAFDLGEWSGVDYAVLPPLVAGYVWYRGLEKRFSMGSTWLAVTIEPPSDWASGNEDVVAGVGVEWGIKGFPVGLILSVGRYDGAAELDFIGIGTSLAMVRQALGGRIAY